jgi:hypothetical protein
MKLKSNKIPSHIETSMGINGPITYSERDEHTQTNKINVFDIEYEKGVELETYFRCFVKCDGLSQLNFNNHLYFCGASFEDNTNGSYLLRYDSSKITNNLNYLINSINHHYFPTMLGYKNEQIVVIGGMNSKNSEVYNLKTNKWKSLPELPEEREKCCAIADDSTDFIYVFGGYNSEFKKNCTTVLRLNMKSLLIWETLVVKGNSSLLARNSCAVIKFDKVNCFYILGGKDNKNELTDTIIEFDINKKVAELINKQLEIKTTFNQSSGNDLNKSEFFLFDEGFNIHKISRNDFKIGFYDSNEIFENEDNNN